MTPQAESKVYKHQTTGEVRVIIDDSAKAVYYRRGLTTKICRAERVDWDRWLSQSVRYTSEGPVQT